MPKGFPNDRMQNLPPPVAAIGGGGPRGPINWDGAVNALLDEFKVPTVSAGSPAEPMRGARILSPDLLKPGMGRPDGCAPNCTLSQEFGVPFSRATFFVMSLRNTETGNLVVPAAIDFEVYFSIGCVRTLVFSGRFSPQSYDYGDLLVQVSGLLATEVAVYAKIDLGVVNNAGAKPYWMNLAVLLDRQDADRQTWRGPDVT